MNTPAPTDQIDLRSMQQEDLPVVLAIIRDHDEDDAEEAEVSYRENGLDNQHVLTRDGRVIGLTGYRNAAGTVDTVWLSWTYLANDTQGQGLGTYMLNSLLQQLRELRYRKIFVSTSDYVDPEDGEIYAAANQLYQNVGFTLELTHPNYYEPGESQLIYGLPLSDINGQRQVAPDESCVFFNGLYEIPETDDTYVINWDVKAKRLFGRNTQFTAQDLQIGLDQAREWGARAVFISFPSNMPSVLPPLEHTGFFEEGRLHDYYEDGVDEVHYRYNLD